MTDKVLPQLPESSPVRVQRIMGFNPHPLASRSKKPPPDRVPRRTTSYTLNPRVPIFPIIYYHRSLRHMSDSSSDESDDYTCLDDDKTNCPSCKFSQSCCNQKCSFCNSSMHIEKVESCTQPQEVVETVVSSDWTDCCICMDKKSNMVFIPCGHMCVCEFDYTKLKTKNCPVCRQEITSSQKVFCV
jgi:hypothetical protein